MKRTIFILLALAFLVIAAISCCEPKKQPERKRYAIISVIEYVEKDSFVWTGTLKVTTIQHSYDTVLIGPKPTGEMTSKQYLINYGHQNY